MKASSSTAPDSNHSDSDRSDSVRESRRAAGVRGAITVLPVFGVAILFVLIWQIAVSVSGIHPILLPGPGAVARSAWENRAILAAATWVTGQAALAGFLTSVGVGFGIALVFSQSRHIRNAFYPYVIFLQTVPIIAIAPLLINWFGYTFSTVVYITVIISLFPIISNVTAGLIAVDPNHDQLFRIYQAGRVTTLLRLRIPSAVPNLLLGMRISSGLAVVGAIIGDFFVGSGTDYNGLGTLMTEWGALQRTGDLIGTLGAATLLGVCFFAGVNLLASLLRRRWLT